MTSVQYMYLTKLFIKLLYTVRDYVIILVNFISVYQNVTQLPQCIVLNFIITECRMTVKGREYRGTKNITKTKKWCQRWGVNWPHKVYRPIYDKLGREEGSWIYTTNYCRNPDYEPGGPWCYTMDPHTRFEACGIPMCHCYT